MKGQPFFQTIIITVDTGMDTAWDKGKGEHSKERRAPLITKPGNSNKIRIMIEKKLQSVERHKEIKSPIER